MQHFTMIGWLLAASNAFFAQRAPQIVSSSRPKGRSRRPNGSYAFKPGRVIELSDGTRYKVQPNGSWVRTSARKCEENILVHNHGSYRRRFRDSDRKAKGL